MGYPAKKTYCNNETARDYDSKRFKGVKGFLVNEMELSLIWKALCFSGIGSVVTILDVPCGTGRMSIYLGQRGFKVQAVDISPQMVSQTRKKAACLSLGDKIVVEQGDVESLPYSDNSFNACISLRLLGHTPPGKRKIILSELRRLTSKYLILAYYSKNSLQGLLRKKRRNMKRIEWHSVSGKQIEEELSAAGIKMIKCFPLLAGISETVVVLGEKA